MKLPLFLLLCFFFFVVVFLFWCPIWRGEVEKEKEPKKKSTLLMERFLPLPLAFQGPKSGQAIHLKRKNDKNETKRPLFMANKRDPEMR